MKVPPTEESPVHSDRLRSQSVSTPQFINYPEGCRRHHVSVCRQSWDHSGGVWLDEQSLSAAVEMCVNWLESCSALWDDWRRSRAIQLDDWLDGGAESGDSCRFGQDQIKSRDKFHHNSLRLRWPWFLCVCANNEHANRVSFHLRRSCTMLLKETSTRLFVTDVNISIYKHTVSSNLLNVQVYRRRMVEADVALNFDPHSHRNTTNPMPTNSPILPFLVLTMAGGCGVSNLMKRAGNNSWVCVCVEVGDGVGLSQDTSVPVKARARPERESCADRNNKPKMAASQSSGKKRRRHSPPVDWRELMWDPSGRLGELEQSGVLQFVRAGFWQLSSKAKTVREVWHRIWSDSETFAHFPMFSSLAPSLYLIGWEN